MELNQGTYGTLAHYVEATLPLTLVTIWVVVAFQNSFSVRDDTGSTLTKLLWPILILGTIFSRPNKKGGRESSILPF